MTGRKRRTLQRSSQHWAYRCLEEGVNRQSLNPNATWAPAPEDEDNFFSLVVKYGLTHHPQAELFENPELVKKKPGRPLLDYVIDARCSPEPGPVSLLLRSGADPNQIYKGRSTWQHALTFTKECSAVHGPDVNSRWAEVYMHFIHAGANMSTCCKIIDQRSIGDMATSGMIFEAHLCSPQWILRHMLHRDLRLYALLDARGATVNNSSLICGSIGEVTEAVRVTSADDCSQLRNIVRGAAERGSGKVERRQWGLVKAERGH